MALWLTFSPSQKKNERRTNNNKVKDIDRLTDIFSIYVIYNYKYKHNY